MVHPFLGFTTPVCEYTRLACRGQSDSNFGWFAVGMPGIPEGTAFTCLGSFEHTGFVDFADSLRGLTD